MYIPTDEFLSTATDTELVNRKKRHETALGVVHSSHLRWVNRKAIALIRDEISARAQVAIARKTEALLSRFRQKTSEVTFG
jgi:hypothetical protein